MTLRFSLVKVLIICSTLFFLQSSIADDLTDVRELTRKNVDIVIGLLKDKKLATAAKGRKIIAAVKTIFDFELMAKLSLGKKHWAPLTPAKRDQFIEFFVQRLQNSYLDKLELYSDETVTIENAKQIKKNRIQVTSYLVSANDKKEMLYKYYKTKTGWKIYDLDILGVSIVQTYRSQFSGLLKNKSMDDLLKNIAAEVKK